MCWEECCGYRAQLYGSPAEVQCKFFAPISGLNFGRWILGGVSLEGEFSGGLFCWKKKDEKIRPKNSGPNSFPRIWPQILRSPWPLTGVIRALGARNPKKSKKGSRGLSDPGSRKVKKRLKKVVFWLVFDLFFRLLSQPFWWPREPFFDFFGILGPKGPNDSCKWPGRLQPKFGFRRRKIPCAEICPWQYGAIRQDFYQTDARITGNQGLAQVFLGPFSALNTGT